MSSYAYPQTPDPVSRPKPPPLNRQSRDQGFIFARGNTPAKRNGKALERVQSPSEPKLQTIADEESGNMSYANTVEGARGGGTSTIDDQPFHATDIAKGEQLDQTPTKQSSPIPTEPGIRRKPVGSGKIEIPAREEEDTHAKKGKERKPLFQEGDYDELLNGRCYKPEIKPKFPTSKMWERPGKEKYETSEVTVHDLGNDSAMTVYDTGNDSTIRAYDTGNNSARHSGTKSTKGCFCVVM